MILISERAFNVWSVAYFDYQFLLFNTGSHWELNGDNDIVILGSSVDSDINKVLLSVFRYLTVNYPITPTPTPGGNRRKADPPVIDTTKRAKVLPNEPTKGGNDGGE